MGQIPGDVAAALGRSIRKVAKAVVAATGVSDYNVLQNNGKPAHQEVPHVHFHIIPKPSASKGLGVQWPAEKLADDDAKAMQAKIVAALEADTGATSARRLPRNVMPVPKW